MGFLQATTAKHVKVEQTFDPEIAVSKQPHRNMLTFSLRPRSSLLLTIEPSSLAQQQLPPWIPHLKAIVLLPSTKTDSIFALTCAAVHLMKSNRLRKQFEMCLEGGRNAVSNATQKKRPRLRLNDALKIKDRAAIILRDYTPGCDATICFGAFRVNERAQSPFGIGLLKGYRAKDDMCTISFSWGEGRLHVSSISKVINNRRKRKSDDLAAELEEMEPVALLDSDAEEELLASLCN